MFDDRIGRLNCVMENPKVASILLPLSSDRNRASNNSGFTLVELLIVIAIVAILSTVAYGSFAKFKELARIARCCEEIRSLEREITAYATERGELPPNLAAINRHELKDPWGQGYHYYPAALPIDPTNAGPNNRIKGGKTINSDFDLYSTGTDGLSAQSIVDNDSLDDIIRANDGSFVAQAKDHGI